MAFGSNTGHPQHYGGSAVSFLCVVDHPTQLYRSSVSQIIPHSPPPGRGSGGGGSGGGSWWPWGGKKPTPPPKRQYGRDSGRLDDLWSMWQDEEEARRHSFEGAEDYW